MKKSIGLTGLVCFLLVGCNPKPTTEVINEPVDKTMKEADIAGIEQATTVSKREDYLKKLAEIEQSLAEFDQALENGSTVELKQAQGEILTRWDNMLNEIYQALEEQLSPSNMEKLREEQREWIKYRDDAAKDAAAKYEGGTMESLEYISVQAGLTKERCYELVEKYME
ncbi:lysozyme inhibitor LprI family protein [Bacillus sp. J37]|uniref:lysozyme inhibitor LprI family protein n=1 Tax=Bacillus sp. J37 TaxID=935837 RepID=UPI0004B42F06|nr:lysozyme inhibitor LprI family protein [Bacillus sp. J37]